MPLDSEIGLLKRAIARIRHTNGNVVGAGFLISESCLLTCAHVVTEALGLPQNHSEIPTATVELDFPCSTNSTPLKIKAQVVFWSGVNPGRRGEDIAGLKIEGVLPEGIQPVSLIKAARWWKHSFGTLGFPKGHDSGVWASGELKEQRGDDGWVQLEAIRAEGYPVLPGFSGSPVWDEQEGGIVGMTVAAEKQRSEARTAFMIPTEILANAIEALSLIEILTPSYHLIDRSIQTAFIACCPKGWSSPLPTTLPAIVTELQHMLPGDAQSSRILQFVVRLANSVSAIHPSLENWAISQGHDWQALMSQIPPAPKIGQMSYLVIKVEDTKPKSERYFIEAWFVPEAVRGNRWDWRCKPLSVPKEHSEQKTFTVDQLPDLLEVFLNQVDEFHDLTIEFFLPLDLLNLKVDTWEIQGFGLTETASHNYKMVVRSVERLHTSYNQFRGAWRQKWQALQQIQQQRSQDVFVSGEDCDPRMLLRQLRLEEVVGLQLAQLPEQTKLKGIFAALLQAGLPVGLWVRENLTQCNCRSEVERILECCVMELPEQVRQERSNSCDCDPDMHIGHHLSLLWEDPDRLPEVLQYEMPSL